MSDRYSRPPNSRPSFDFGVETLRKCLDDAAAKPSFRLRKDAILLANPIVSHRKLPICPIDFIRDDDLSLRICSGKRAITSSSHCSSTSPVPVESWELLGIFTRTRQTAVTFGIFRTQPGGGIWTISCLML